MDMFVCRFSLQEPSVAIQSRNAIRYICSRGGGSKPRLRRDRGQLSPRSAGLAVRIDEAGAPTTPRTDWQRSSVGGRSFRWCEVQDEAAQGTGYRPGDAQSDVLAMGDG